MSREDDDDILALLQHNFLLVEKIGALISQNALLMQVIRLRDALDKNGFEAWATTVPGLEGRA
jgi:hypothetical protein